MTVFNPYGPFQVPVRHLPRGRVIATDEVIREWWHSSGLPDGIALACGLFVFAMRAGSHYVPYYVGRTSRQGFARECFTPHKRNKYNHALALQGGTPVLCLIAHPKRRGPINNTAICSLEIELIKHAHRCNPNLLNERLLEALPAWTVAGVLRSNDHPTESASKLKQILGMAS